MSSALRAEVLKLRTTRTTVGLASVMAGLALLAVILHALSFSPKDLVAELRVLGFGVSLGAVFAGLAGALSLTTEVRHGTIRPTFLGIPRRGRVLWAKAITSMATGAAFGLIATAVAAAVGSAILAGRGLPIYLGGADYALLVIGGTAAGALWGVIGLGLGAVVRNQVAVVVAIFVWVEIVENLLTDSVPGASKFLPGALGEAIAGQRTGTLHSPALGALLLAAYAAVVIAVGRRAVVRRDVA